MAGTGIGRKSLEEIAKMNGKNVEDYIEILKKNKIDADKTQSIKDLASQYDMPAREIYELITK